MEEKKLDVEWIIENHEHADHLSAAAYLNDFLGGKVAISEHVTKVQETFGKIFNAGDEFKCYGSQFDHLFTDGESYTIGTPHCLPMHTPGHTPACMTHVIGDAAFVGDTIFMPDSGTACSNFPGGDAATLFQSTHKILGLPPKTRIFMCHDYCADELRGVEYLTTVKAKLEGNIHVNKPIDKADFVEMRQKRERGLAAPT